MHFDALRNRPSLGLFKVQKLCSTGSAKVKHSRQLPGEFGLKFANFISFQKFFQDMKEYHKKGGPAKL